MTVPSPDLRIYVVGLQGAEDDFAEYLEARVEAEEATLELQDDADDHAERQDHALDRIERALDLMTLRAVARAAQIEQRTRARLRRQQTRRANLQRQRGGGAGLRNFALRR